MAERLYQADAFTDVPFRGNPAAVCLLRERRPDTWMQAVAQEMNLSETAFLHKIDDGYRLRWFTPETEVDLCGHATLASAHILWETERLSRNSEAVFDALSGILKARIVNDEIELDFPAATVEGIADSSLLVEALKVSANNVFKGESFYLVALDSYGTVRDLQPDFGKLKAQSPERAVVVTAMADGKDYYIVSRCFGPNVGIDEDPVTGSAHCLLGPYWSRRLGRTEFMAYQASERGGQVRVRVEGDRVFLAGQAVTVLRVDLVEH